MAVLPEGTEEFDERRFRALLDLAGPSTALELTSRLDEDLCHVATALTESEKPMDQHVLRAQSHVLLAIAGTIGANRLYHLSERLNGLAKAPDAGPVADILCEIRALLERLILYIRLTHARLAGER